MKSQTFLLWPLQRTQGVFVLLASLLLVAACQPQGDEDGLEFKVPVSVAPVGKDNIEELIVATGNVRAPEVITLTVMTSGLLQIGMGEKGRLAEGDTVKSGDLIANITGEDVRLAANMRVAQQQLEVARKNLEATRTLFEKKLVSTADYGRDKTAYENAKHQYEKSLHSENRNKIITPIDGVILKLARDNGQAMANGQLVQAGQEIAQVAPLDTLVVDVNVVGRDIAKVVPGLKARVRYHAWPDKAFAGEIVRIAPTIDTQTRTLGVEVKLDNQEGLVRPGMFVEVALVAERREGVPVVPRSALALRGGKRVVFVLNGERAEQRRVELGLGDDEQVEIRNGIAVGENVVVLGIETLSDNMPVRVTGS